MPGLTKIPPRRAYNPPIVPNQTQPLALSEANPPQPRFSTRYNKCDRTYAYIEKATNNATGDN
ncbi:MAG: hypothetical protein HC941_18055 [Microcoleus sp. SU_5_3]|nr:hypothetical protein [Microcoleus sp. SU_5_3]